MQVRIARILNKLLIIFAALVLVLFTGIFFVAKQYPDYRFYYIAAFVIITVTLTVVFKWLENRWDKSVILKMTREGKIALMNIRGGRRLFPLRDTGLVNYWIYEIEGDLYNGEHEKLEKVFHEKMNRDEGEIPQGSVYVTYDDTKPSQIFIIPNAVIGNLPNLIPIVASYEKDKKIDVKYLDVFYRRGMVLRTVREAMAEYKLKGQAGGQPKKGPGQHTGKRV
ncbi:MAG: hypothetical protein LBG25_01295 [Spirochaetaceae bacterium]|jgi:uncharacterized membrane protein YedE/YeeE|nr:hypothetical protein [Spirochaetaceae bacterium]